MAQSFKALFRPGGRKYFIFRGVKSGRGKLGLWFRFLDSILAGVFGVGFGEYNSG